MNPILAYHTDVWNVIGNMKSPHSMPARCRQNREPPVYFSYFDQTDACLKILEGVTGGL